ncbi:putative fructokinase-5 isoform B [Senna tora]|uniref:Putative fructokinase-5 isoform B n=1 Tax=Senna tora TaxID=362788 RepID=A0A834W9E1_9FABA|nr:putative fructokinase-5 isoform B [Senna tora]
MAYVGTFSPNHSLLFSGTKHSLQYPASTRRGVVVVVRAESMTTEKLGIKIEKNPPEEKLTQLGVRKWPKWGCPPSNFPWTYEAKETCYLLEGKVKVTPSGSDESVEIGAGDLVVFPKGMSCTWDVSVGVDKHYNFE